MKVAAEIKSRHPAQMGLALPLEPSDRFRDENSAVALMYLRMAARGNDGGSVVFAVGTALKLILEVFSLGRSAHGITPDRRDELLEAAIEARLAVRRHLSGQALNDIDSGLQALQGMATYLAGSLEERGRHADDYRQDLMDTARAAQHMAGLMECRRRLAIRARRRAAIRREQ